MKTATKVKLPKAILCDIDGTLSHMTDRGPFEWSRVGEDKPDFFVWDILCKYNEHGYDGEDVTIILISGRDGVCRDETEKWLASYDIPYDRLLMRPAHNNEKDFVIKQRIYDTEINDKYDVLFVLDDRDQVVKMWRRNGLRCYQVAEGDF